MTDAARRVRGRSRWTPIATVAPGLVVAAGLLAACGSGAAPDGLGPPEAAASLTRSFDLTTEQGDCLRGRFEQTPSAAAALLPDEAPSDEDRDAFLAVMRACVPPDAFGATLAATLRDEMPEATAEQATCVHDNVVALAAPEQDRLYLYFANPAGFDVDDVGQAGTDLFASCDLAGTSGATGSTGATATPATPTAPG
jgi:hypothetical protein